MRWLVFTLVTPGNLCSWTSNTFHRLLHYSEYFFPNLLFTTEASAKIVSHQSDGTVTVKSIEPWMGNGSKGNTCTCTPTCCLVERDIIPHAWTCEDKTIITQISWSLYLRTFACCWELKTLELSLRMNVVAIDHTICLPILICEHQSWAAKFVDKMDFNVVDTKNVFFFKLRVRQVSGCLFRCCKMVLSLMSSLG